MSKEKAADYFSRYKSDECHITSDERVFHTIGAAQSFASGLKDTKIASYTRAEFETVKSDDSQDEAKVQALEALKNFDATTALYPEIKALFKDLGLDAPTQKQPDLLAAIEAYKTAINTEVKE